MQFCILISGITQIPDQAGKHARQCRIEAEWPTQIITKAEFVEKRLDQKEITIGKWIAAKIDNDIMGPLKEAK